MTHTFKATSLAALVAISWTMGSHAYAQSAVPPIPKRAVPSPEASEQGDFELPSPAVPTSHYPTPTYGAWTFGSGSGIAGEDSTFANPNSPNGNFVAYLDGTASFQVPVTLPTGTYRVHYDMARLAGGSGENFVRIKVNNLIVAEDEDITETYQAYVSRPFFLRGAGTKTLSFTGVGDPSRTALIDNIVLEKVREWNDPTAWDTGVVPGVNDIVTLPPNTVIAISGDREVAEVQIEGELVVARRNGSLSADLIRVMGSGARLEIGRARVPYIKDFTIELTGDYNPNTASGQTPGAAYKALMAMNDGVIELHGAPKTSWTRLLPTTTYSVDLQTGQPVHQIVVENFDGWKVGDQVVIAGSVGQPAREPLYEDRNEVRSIKTLLSVTLPGTNYTENRIVLGSAADQSVYDPFDYEHFYGSPLQRQVSGQTLTLDQRAEVGMLTHNIVVRGSVDDVVTQPAQAYGAEAGFGGHVMIMSTNLGIAPVGRARFSNVELTKLGQSRVVGRYPFHWHLVSDDGAGQYIRDCSVHDTFNRAITVHGTDNALVEGNVCHDNLGHAVFLEDGSEMDNVIRRNLTMSTQKPAAGDETIISDNELSDFQNRTPAAYWITNPNNIIDDNVAAGTIGSGFWFIFSQNVLGLSASQGTGHNASVRPYQQPLGSFKGNVAHGCALGFDVHDGQQANGAIRKNLNWLPPQPPAVLEDFTIYACDTAIYAGIAPGTVWFQGARMADNFQTLILASYDEVRDSMIIAESGNGLAPPGRPLEAYRIYDGAGRVVDTLLEGFDDVDHVLINHNRAATRHPNHYFKGVTLSPPTPYIEWRDFLCHFSGGTNCPPVGAAGNPACPPGDNDFPTDTGTWGLVVYDADGILTGQTTPQSIISNADMLRVYDAQEVSVGPNAWRTSRRYGLFRVEFPVTDPITTPPGPVTPTRFTRTHASFPDQEYCARKMSARFQQMPMIVNDGFTYEIEFVPDASTQIQQDPGTAPDQSEIALIFEDNDPGDVTDIEIKGVAALAGLSPLSVTCSSGIVSVNTLNDLGSQTVTSYFYDEFGTGSLHVRNVQVRGITEPSGAIFLNKEDRIDINW